MLNVKNIVKKIPYLYSLLRGFKKQIGKLFYNNDSGIPVYPYYYTKQDALSVFNVIMSQKLHHKVGKEVRLLEEEFSAYHNSRYSLATNAGTSALEMAIKSIGIKPGDEIILPAYTFVATAQAILSRGGIPIFADIDDTYTIDPNSIIQKITPRTKGIIPVHIFGNVADMDKILKIARTNNLYVIEDACQAVGAKYRGKPVGSIGDIGCFSFDIFKAISTGQGGMLITNNKKFYNIAYHTRETGQLKDELGSDVVTTGNTYALTEMQGALARSILGQLDRLNFLRRQNYEHFINLINTTSLPIHWYRILPEVTPSFSRLVFMLNFNKLKIKRTEFIRKLRFLSIPLKTFYPVPLYKYSLFKYKRDLYTKNTFPFNKTRVNYHGLKLNYAEIFCKQQVGMEFSPYLKKHHLLLITKILREQILDNLL